METTTKQKKGIEWRVLGCIGAIGVIAVCLILVGALFFRSPVAAPEELTVQQFTAAVEAGHLAPSRDGVVGVDLISSTQSGEPQVMLRGLLTKPEEKQSGLKAFVVHLSAAERPGLIAFLKERGIAVREL